MPCEELVQEQCHLLVGLLDVSSVLNLGCVVWRFFKL